MRSRASYPARRKPSTGQPYAPPYTFDSTTNIYKNGSLTTTVTGWAVGWLDNGRVLANTFVSGGVSDPVYVGDVIYDPSGEPLGGPSLPQMMAIELVQPNSVYSSSPFVGNVIVSLASGAVTWASGDSYAGVGAVGGSQVVFASGSFVLVQPY